MFQGKRGAFAALVGVGLWCSVGNGIGWALAATEANPEKAKYVFLFIGDGMGIAQRNAAELYLANQKGLKRPEEAKLSALI